MADYTDFYSGRTSILKGDEGEIKKIVNPRIIDNKIFSCDVKKLNERTTVHEIEELNEKAITVENIYRNPYAVRNIINALPHQLNRQYTDSDYPGYVANIDMHMPDLYLVIKKIILMNFKYFNLELKELNIKFGFKSGLYTSKNITYENTPIFIHKDSKKGFAGVIYLNLPEECDGGTAIYKKIDNYKFEKLHEFKMKFNTLILYPSHCYHGLTFNDIETSFSDYYRVTQRFFIDFSRP